MPAPELVVFDIAGTTIRATDQVPGAFTQAFARIGITLSDEDIQAIRGRSKHDAIADLLDKHACDADAIKVYRYFQKDLLQRYETQGIEAIDGASDTFEWLRSRGAKIALNTGFDRALAERLIQMVGWDEKVDAMVCNDDVSHGRPAPDLLFRAMDWTACRNADQVAAVGDTISDLEAAENAGVKWRIGVLSGAHNADQLSSRPHSAIIDSVADLPGVF